MEQFANNASTNLNGSIDGTSNPVTFTVASATRFPTVGNFRVIIDAEIMIVTSVSGNNFTATRAAEGTTIAAHSDGRGVTHVLTKGSLYTFLQDHNLRGNFSVRPTAELLGRKYYCADCPFWYYDDGANWQKYYGSYPLVTPSNSGFSWDNQAAATLTTTKDMLTMFPDNGSHFRYKTAPSTPWKITTAVLFNTNPLHMLDYYLGFRKNSDGKLVGAAIRSNGSSLTFNSWKWNTSTSFNAAYQSNNMCWPPGGLIFVRIEDNGTNRIISLSTDGVNFSVFHTIGRTDFATCDEVMWGTGSDAGTPFTSASLIHWYQE